MSLRPSFAYFRLYLPRNCTTCCFSPLFPPAVDQPFPIRVLAGPKTAGKGDALRLLLAHPVNVHTRRRAPCGDPNSPVSVGSIERYSPVGIGLHHGGCGVSIGIVPSDRDDRISWTYPFQPVAIERACRTMMRHFHHLHRCPMVLRAHASQRFCFNIGRKEKVVKTARDLRDDRPVVERMPFLSAASPPLTEPHDLWWIQDLEPTFAEADRILA